MKRKAKKLISLFLAALMIFALCACGSASSSADKSMLQMDSPAENYSMSETAYDSEDDYGGFSAGSGTTADGSEQSGDINPDKIIYSADATLETTDFDTATEKLDMLIKQYGGFVESSSVRGVNI